MSSLRTVIESISEDVINKRNAEGIETPPEALSPLNDKAAALFTMTVALGNIIAPTLGGWLVDHRSKIAGTDECQTWCNEPITDPNYIKYCADGL